MHLSHPSLVMLGLSAVVGGLGALAGCGGSAPERATRAPDTTCDGRQPNGKTTITAWFHDGQGTERKVLETQVAAFNASSRNVRVKLLVLPETDYGALVQSAADSGELPDLLDFDGPNLYSHAWSGKLRPLDSCLPRSTRQDLLPSIRAQGSYAGRLWGIGTFDSGMGLYVRPSILKKVGARIPSGAQDAWTGAEFTQLLHRLKAAGYRHPLDLKLETLPDRKEFATYAFAPLLWSAGGDLIDRSSYRTAQGVLNGAASIRALTTLQQWVTDGLVDPNTENTAFVSGRSPISWVGHWEFRPNTAAFPGDVQLAPLPRLGPETKTGMGSWQWGLPAGAADGDAAWSFLQFLLTPTEVLRMTAANGAIPGLQSSLSQTTDFRPGGPQRLYADQLIDGVALPRPSTPAYPVITKAFATAVDRIVDGKDVRQELDRAALTIDRDIRANRGYPAPN